MNKQEKKEAKEIAKLMNDYKKALVEEGIEFDLAKNMVRDFHKSVVDSMLAKQKMKEFEKGFKSALQDDIFNEFRMDLSDLDA
jgi:predicted metal-binding protein